MCHTVRLWFLHSQTMLFKRIQALVIFTLFHRKQEVDSYMCCRTLLDFSEIDTFTIWKKNVVFNKVKEFILLSLGDSVCSWQSGLCAYLNCSVFFKWISPHNIYFCFSLFYQGIQSFIHATILWTGCLQLIAARCRQKLKATWCFQTPWHKHSV